MSGFAGKMIKINLLPQDYRKKKETRIFAGLLSFKKTILVVTGIFILQIFIIFLYFRKTSQWRISQKELKALQPELDSVRKLQTEYRDIKTMNDSLDNLIRRPYFISYFFDRLIDATPDGLWFHKININERNIVLTGASVSLSGEEESGKVNNLVKLLSQGRDFKNIIKNVSLKSLRRKSVGYREVVDFVIICRLVH